MTEPYGREGLPLEQARTWILAAIKPLQRPETLALAACLGRVTAEPVGASQAVPGFRASIMDGYAIAGEAVPEVGRRWRLVGRSAAGAPFSNRLDEGEAVRILTGAVVPEGSGRVLPQELVGLLEAEPEAAHDDGAPRAGDRGAPADAGAAGQKDGPAASDGSAPSVAAGIGSRRPTAVPGNEAPGAAGSSTWLELRQPCGPNPWIRHPEEECGVGTQLLAAGQRLGVADLGRLASCGVERLVVNARPRIGLLISGDELLPAGSERGPGQIWESNSLLLTALLQRLGHAVEHVRVVADQPAPLRSALQELAADCDVVVSTGGVSAGDSDWIRQLVAELGEVAFWKLYLRPGRPFAWGQVAGTPFFGLPGNPVAAAITALQLLHPALQRLEGAEPQPLPRLKVTLAHDLRRGSGRPELARARLVIGADGAPMARVEGSQASSRIGSLQGADLLLEIPADLGNLEAGTVLWAQLLRLELF